MIEHHLSRKRLDAVLPLVDELDHLPEYLHQEVLKLRNEQTVMQHELEQYREDQNRRQSSTLFRSSLLMGTLVSSLLLLYYLFQIDDVDPNSLSSELLFIQSLVLALPLVPVVIIGRKRILVSSNARRALIALVGMLLAVILHRWISMEYQSCRPLSS